MLDLNSVFDVFSHTVRCRILIGNIAELLRLWLSFSHYNEAIRNTPIPVCHLVHCIDNHAMFEYCWHELNNLMITIVPYDLSSLCCFVILTELWLLVLRKCLAYKEPLHGYTAWPRLMGLCRRKANVSLSITCITELELIGSLCRLP
jgi:hypothetical protein